MRELLTNVCRIQYGFAFDSSKFSGNDGIPLVRIRDVVRGFSETYTTEKCSEDYLVHDGDILIGMDGEFNIAKWQGGNALLNQRVCKLQPIDRVNADYLFYFMSTALKAIEEKTPFVTVKHLSAKELNQVEIPLLPLEQQIKIADILNGVSAMIAIRRQQLTELDTLVKARFVEMFGDPIDNPLGWPVRRLSEICVLITNGNTPQGGSSNYVDRGILFLRSQNVWRNRIELDDVAYIDEATHKSMKKSSLHNRDILITKTGRINTENSSLGRSALFTGEDDSANINGHVYLVRIRDSALPEFVVQVLTGEPYRKYIRKVCVGGIDKRQINLDQVEDFPIIIPPMDIQREYTDFAAQVDKSKSLVQKALEEAQTLFDSLMQQYFG